MAILIRKASEQAANILASLNADVQAVTPPLRRGDSSRPDPICFPPSSRISRAGNKT
jgi:hypothetical protein